MKTLYDKGVFIPAVAACVVVAGAMFCTQMAEPLCALLFSAASAVLLLYHFIASRLYFSCMKKSAASVVRYYMIHFFLRFIVGGIVLVAGACLLSGDSRLYILSVCLLFLVILVSESIVYVKLEKQLKRNQNDK